MGREKRGGEARKGNIGDIGVIFWKRRQGEKAQRKGIVALAVA